ncbi:uncharacterized protein LOC125665553 [Ostrea edulis]|uniref:uncharacterized protein LOC125665553 n=1 Tax=Ostrea edulis TaxID=37623 RepID=UPI0024AEEF02|nr:uncharacterized protein LOC125665553 [Ostrea edulis]
MTKRKSEVLKTAPSNKSRDRTSAFIRMETTKPHQRQQQVRQPNLLLLGLTLLQNFSHFHTSNSPFVANLQGVNHNPVMFASAVSLLNTGKPTVQKRNHKVNDKYTVLDRRIDDIFSLRRTISRFPNVTARELAKVVGEIISMTPVMDKFKVGRLKEISRKLQDCPLSELVSELPKYCLASKAKNTTIQYRIRREVHKESA